MANVISSAIVNTPPPEMMGDILNKRNKTHHFDYDTEENMIPMFTHDVDGKARNNKHLLPRRNWCSIREYHPGHTPPQTPTDAGSLMSDSGPAKPGRLQRTLSLTRGDMKPGNLVRRLSQRGPNQGYPPSNEYRSSPTAAPSPPQRSPEADGYFSSLPKASANAPPNGASAFSSAPLPRPGNFHRRPTNMSIKAIKKGGADVDEKEGHVNLEHGLDIVLNCEVSPKDPAGITVPYRLLIPALWYEGQGDVNEDPYRKRNILQRFSSLRGSRRRSLANNQGQGNWGQSQESYAASETPSEVSEHQARQDVEMGRGGAMGLFRRLSQGAAGRRVPDRETPPGRQLGEMSETPSEASEEQVRQDAGMGRGGAMGLFRRLSGGAAGRRESNRDTPPRTQHDEVVEDRPEKAGLFQRRPSTKDGPKPQLPITTNEHPEARQTHDRVEGMSLFNRHASNPARVGPISQPMPGLQARTITTTTTTKFQSGQQQQLPQRCASATERVEGMGIFPRRAASTNTRPPPVQQPQSQSQPLSLRTMEARASQQEQRDFERRGDGYPGRRPSKLDRVLGTGHARDEPVEQGKGPSFAARQGSVGAMDGADDDYYSDEGQSVSEISEQGGGPTKGYGGIEAYKEQKGWRRFF